MLLQELQDFKHSRKPKPFLGAFLIQTCFDRLGIFGCSIIQGYIFQANIWFSFKKGLLMTLNSCSKTR